MTQPVFYKDLLAGQKSFTEADLGRKGLSLALLVSHNVPIPPFFILKPDVFKSVVSTIFHDTDVASLEEFRAKLSKTPLSPQIINSIETEYQKLSGFGKAWTSVRSSIVAPLHPDAAFSGLLHSLLNIRGTNDIENAVKEIFMSLFQDRSYDYLKHNKISYSDVSTAVIVQKMIQAEVSGTMYTYDPITTEREHVSIEAVFGLGDVLADGSLNPDVYTVAKSSLEIIEKKIVPQEWMKVRKVGDSETLEHLQRITISKVWQYAQKLDDSLIRELTKLADAIERALGGPQVIEWVMERGNIYILQAKPMTTHTETSQELHDPKRKITSMHDIDTFVAAAEQTNITVTTSNENMEPTAISDDLKESTPTLPQPVALPNETLLFIGSPASHGIAYGEALIIPSVSALTEEALKELKQTVAKTHIIIVDEFSSNLEALFIQAGGIVTNYGGVNSDAALTARELHLPAVVGTRIATSFLQTGILLKVDGSSGAIYRVDHIPEQAAVTESPLFNEQDKLHLGSSDVNEKNTGTLFTSPAKTPRSESLENLEKQTYTQMSVPDADRLFPIFLTDTPSAQYVVLKSAKDKLPEATVKAVLFPVKTADKVELLYIKKLKNRLLADIYLVISDMPSIDSLISIKRTLAAHGIRRTKRMKILISIGSVYGLLNSKNLADIAVDGFLYDVEALANSYLPGATDIDAKLWQLVSENIDIIKQVKLSFVGMVLPKEYFTIPLRKELAPLIKKGITSLVFTEHMPHVLEADVTALGKAMEVVQIGI